MLNYLVQGLLLGLAYVAPIGMQNLYVINTGIRGSRVRTYQVALITIFFDITLALACFLGIGFLIRKFPVFRAIIFLFGALLVMYIGIKLILDSSERIEDLDINQSMLKVILTCFIVTWLNPQAIIDGSLLLGGYRASISNDMAKFFILGFCSASFIWFISLSTIVLKLRSSMSSKIIKLINIVCGIILIGFGIKLGYSFVKYI